MSKPIPSEIREQRLQQLHKYMAENNLKSTRQRDLIVQIFFETLEHISVEELYQEVRNRDENIGFATVYRTLNLLADSGLANRRNFGDGHARYENTYEGEHHDHIICTKCGDISEFESEKLDSFKKSIADQKGFKITSYKMEIYGLCADCHG